MRNSLLIILVIAVLISTLGVLSIFSSTYQREGRAWQTIYQRQILWIILGLFLFFLVANINYRRFWDWTYLLYILTFFFLLLVLLLGSVRLGAQRWLRFGWFNFQPSELAKLVMTIFFARYFSCKSIDDVSLLSGRFGVFRGLALPFFFTAIPMGLIIEQPDLGTGMVLLFLFVFMLYLTNVKLRYIIILSVLVILLMPFMWYLLRDYQKDRLMVFLNPNIDPLGAGYTVIQSKIAIGSGGFLGKGWLLGTQSQLRFLPESHTDFIFATFSEEWGLLGGAGLLFLYYLLIRQSFLIAQRTQDYFGRLMALGISLMLSIQVIINVAMNIGVAPIVGISLPLMSYGGSSVFVTFIALGILVNIDKTRAVF
ncbi:MAG: rod shape-determining protein RodA [Candidatus Omnitrophica bacterium CG08_land_8_20_14_0_20_41_16]|uniref:Peptidoglycan glycosyltransferase RodA n=1 Tax=Candidatus Sherwoodlollariibacterium unditelluris TaxID=1974757 RepID=A0A2G9YL79_9BACT|nr:MAG: rod shape-determining protein RodA [Candidatus Omnitrophica bacterium CG23_combo_of_CG06-09_8_20_14_all_41_10]PIS33541.1 MAG: rod shape-determining protein RodA [Candidatus Omnitrophica bacterium CG08_land_8_20_14_0_20_41_16]